MNKKIAALLLGALPLVVYLGTRAPTITWRNDGADSGDLVTAAFTLGIPHPTGYPLYTILAAIFSHLPFGEPAQNVGALSALAAAGAIIFLARAGSAILREENEPLTRWIPPSIALTFAFAPAFWSQATIAEVNALAAFFTAALFAALFSNSPHRLYLTALNLGFSLAHHVTILLLLPSAIILLSSERYTRSQYLRAALLLLVPLALYFYLPIRAATHPPVNWGNPETLDGFLWVVSGAPYHQYLFAISPIEMLARGGLIARLLFGQFTVVGVALGLWGALRMASDARARRVFIALALAFGITAAYAIAYNSRDSFVYLMPAFMIFALWMMYGINDLPTRGIFPLPLAETARARVNAAFLVLLVLLPVYNLGANFGKMNLASDFTARDYGKNILTSISDNAVIIADGDEHDFALEYFGHVIAPEKNQLIVSPELLQYAWYFDNIRRALHGVNAAAANQVERLTEIIDISLAQRREVYTTLRSDLFSRYALEPRENFYRVLGRLP